MIERLQRRLGLKHPFVEIFSNDPRLGALAGNASEPEATRSQA
jgi:hypothetical protein